MRNMLITGGTQEDRIDYATSLSMKLLCERKEKEKACLSCSNCKRVLSRSHPNIIYIEPIPTKKDTEKNIDTDLGSSHHDIKIAQIRRVVQDSQKTNYEKGVAIFIISHMHQMTRSAANALLKIIEESPDGKVFIAISPSRTAVLPTISSRMISHIVSPKPYSADEVSKETCDKIWKITKTEPKLRLEFCSQFSTERAKLINQLHELELACHVLLRAFSEKSHELHDYALNPRVALKIGEALLNAHAQLLKNLNPRLVAENLIFSHWPYACQLNS